MGFSQNLSDGFKATTGGYSTKKMAFAVLVVAIIVGSFAGMSVQNLTLLISFACILQGISWGDKKIKADVQPDLIKDNV